METNELRIDPAHHTFFGRERELREALAVLDEALGGAGRLLLVSGEPGIGKSRMADELAAYARERGVLVAWGSCWEAGGAPAYWPWVQSLRSMIHHLDAGDLKAQMGSGAVHVAQLLPEVHGTLGDLPAPTELEPDAARFRLFDSATTFLKNAAGVRPLMLVLDDLQVADTPSLLLLRFVAGALGDDRILIVGTYRDTDLRPDHPLAAALTELTREHAVRRLALHGLAHTDVARMIAVTAGVAPQDSLVRAVHDETDGNPLFLGEVVRLLIEEGRLTASGSDAGPRVGMPRSVREVIGQRLKHLPPDCLDILRMASVLGREFSLDALSRLADLPFDEVLAALDEPLAARVISDVPGTRSRLRFSHAVIRECLYDDIGRARRAQLHRRAAQVLEAVYGEDAEAHLAELAHHFFEGAPGGDPAKAIRYARAAGAKAASLLGYEEAVRLLDMALQALELSDEPDPTEECEVLLALGDARARAGDEAGSKHVLFRAADLARALGLREHLARAALGYGGRFIWLRAADDSRVIPLLEDALAAIGDGDSSLGAMIRARLAGALRDRASPEPRETLSREAVDMARRLGDALTLDYTLGGMWAALWKPDNPWERLAISNEILALGERAGDRERVLQGHQNRALVLFELGDIAALHRELDTVLHMAKQLRQPVQNWLPVGARALLALFEGRFADAEPLMAEAISLGGRSNRSDALAANTLHLFQLRREQGRLAEIEELMARSAREFTWYPMFRCALAVLLCDLGHTHAARGLFEELATADFAALPFDNEWLFSMSLLSEVASVLGDRHRAATLYEMLSPYAERNAFGALEGCTGSVARCLGLLAAVMERPDDAARHFEAAIEHNVRMGSRPWVARSQHSYALLLMRRDAPRDRPRAVELLVAARSTCEELGMLALGAAVTAALDGLGIAAVTVPAALDREHPSRQPGAVSPAVEDGSFALEGEYWTVGYEGRRLRLRDSKGLRVLALLLANPGRPHPALDLERLGAFGDEQTARAVASGDAGEHIDDRARRAYRARLAELRVEMAEAEGRGQADQAGALQEEVDFIARELGHALGLGGRARHAGSVSERARLNVTRAVKSAMKRIATTDLGLAAHLEATIHTGTVCVYSPDPRSAVTWHVAHGGVRQG